MLVVDASVLVVALTDGGHDGGRARERLRGEDLAAPELVDLEVASALRKLVAAGAVDIRRAEMALDDLTDLPLRRAPHMPLLTRCWELRENLTAYDAAYVALAEVLGGSLLTADVRISRAPAVRCPIESSDDPDQPQLAAPHRDPLVVPTTILSARGRPGPE